MRPHLAPEREDVGLDRTPGRPVVEEASHAAVDFEAGNDEEPAGEGGHSKDTPCSSHQIQELDVESEDGSGRSLL